MHDPQDDDRLQDSLESTDQTKDSTAPIGPAGGPIDLDGLGEGSNLYPQEDALKREGNLGHQKEDLSINSDGTNPGTEYFPPLHDFEEN